MGKVSSVRPLPLERTFDSFVEHFGGELIDRLLPTQSKRADYLFRQQGVIAELKRLEKQTFDADYHQKLTQLCQNWLRRGRVIAFGRVHLNLGQLPPDCQREWLRLLESPIQRNILADANQQIRSTREALAMPTAKGILLLASDGNYCLQPPDVVTLVARILEKKKETGEPIFSAIRAVAFFSLNMFVGTPQAAKCIYWMNGLRDMQDRELSAFLKHLELSWYNCLRNLLNEPIPRYERIDDDIESVKFTPPH
jgi:hypothetical protein